MAETRAERGQLENYKQLTRETEAAKVRRTQRETLSALKSARGRTSQHCSGVCMLEAIGRAPAYTSEVVLGWPTDQRRVDAA